MLREKFPCKAIEKETINVVEINNVNKNNYICDTCNKGFTYAYLLERHKNRKYPCKGIEKEIMKYCTHCGECMEEHKLNLHLKNCKKIKYKDIENSSNKNNTDNNIKCKYCGNIYLKKGINKHYRNSCPDIPKNKKKYYIEKYQNNENHKNKLISGFLK